VSFFKNIFQKIGLAKEDNVSKLTASDETKNVIASEAAARSSLQAPQSSLVLINHAYLEKLEEDLIRSDLGVDLSLEYSALLEAKFLDKEIDESILANELKKFLLSSFDSVIASGEVKNVIASGEAKNVIASGEAAWQSHKLKLDKNKKNIFLIVGVNGVGKTTSIGKLANKFRIDGFKTLIAAGDTFRAAAEAQLELWARRAEVEILQLEDGAKPSAVVYKAVEKIKAEDFNMLLIDTAGRLQNKKDLMLELGKLNDVIRKNMDNHVDSRHCEERSDAAIHPSRHCEELQSSDAAIHPSYNLKTLLVLDATTGSNAISQAENFNEVTKLDGIILTKFDGTAKAGVVFNLARKFNLPVYYTGTGEGIDDISEFDLDEFLKKYF
jgi:fused signal recognition particle receptor